MSEHTPTPWGAGKPSTFVGWPIVASGTGRVICDINYVQRTQIDPHVAGDQAFNAESAANAAFICRAVNAHADLVDFARRVQEGCSFPSNDVERALRDEARKVLAKIERTSAAHEINGIRDDLAELAKAGG